MHEAPLQLVVLSAQSPAESHAAFGAAAGCVTWLHDGALPWGPELPQPVVANSARQACAFTGSKVEAPMRTPRSVAKPPSPLPATYGRNTAAQSAAAPFGSWPHSMTFAQYAVVKLSRNAGYVPVPAEPPPVPEVPPPAAPAPELDDDMQVPDTQLSSMRHVAQIPPFVPQVLDDES